MVSRASKKKKPPSDPNEIAAFIVEQIVDGNGEEKPTKNPAAVALGRLGASKGGRARAEKLSPKRRKEIAKKAAEARWKNKKKKS